MHWIRTQTRNFAALTAIFFMVSIFASVCSGSIKLGPEKDIKSVDQILVGVDISDTEHDCCNRLLLDQIANQCCQLDADLTTDLPALLAKKSTQLDFVAIFPRLIPSESFPFTLSLLTAYHPAQLTLRKQIERNSILLI